MLVSVVIPSFNHARYVGRALDSVFGQTHDDIEVIVVDDGSSDASRAILDSVQHPKLKRIYQENKGAHAAINVGLAHAQGDVLAILNSDDEFHPVRVEQALRAMERDGYDLVSSWISVIDSDGVQLGVKEAWFNNLPPWVDEARAVCDESAKNAIWRSNFISTTSNMVMSRTLLDRVGAFQGYRFVHDWDFALRAASVAEIGVIDRPLLSYRVHDSNTIRASLPEMYVEIALCLVANARRAGHWNVIRPLAPAQGSVFDRVGGISDLVVQLRDISSIASVPMSEQLLWPLSILLDQLAAEGTPFPEQRILENDREVLLQLVEGSDTATQLKAGL